MSQETTDTSEDAPGRAARILPYLAIILLAAVLFSPFLLRGRVFLAADILYTSYPWNAFAGPGFKPRNSNIGDPVIHNWAAIYNRQLHQGSLKNWNPYILTGIPNTGLTAMSGMPGRWHPLKLLFHRLFPAPVVLNLLLFVHVALMGLTMFIYLSEMGAGRRGALFGAVAFMFNGSAMAWLEYEFVVASSALVPLLLLCLERLRGENKFFWTAVGSGILGLHWLMGHPQYMVYTHLLLGFYFLFILWRCYREGALRHDFPKLLASFLIMLSAGALIGAIETLPVVELIANSTRNFTRYGFQDLFRETGRVPWRQLVTLVFPDYFGNPVLGFTAHPTPPSQWIMNFSELALNVGVPTLLAILAAMVAPTRPVTRFFLAMTLLSLLLMTGTLFAYPFFRLVPGMDKMTPTRIIWLFTFSAAAAAGLGFREMERIRGRRRTSYLALLLLFAGAVALFSLVSSRPSVVSFFTAERVLAERPDPPDVFNRLTAVRSLASPAILKPLLFTFGSVILFVLFARVRRAAARSLIFASILGLLAYELIGAAAAHNTTVPRQMIYPKTPAIEFLQRQQGLFRVAMDSTFGITNTMAPFGIQDLGGYSSVFPWRNNELLSLIVAPAGPAYDRWVYFDLAKVQSPSLFDLLNVRYILTAPDRGVPFEHLRLVYQGEMDIYENPGAMPRAYAVHRAIFAQSISEERVPALLKSPDFDARNTVVIHDRPGESALPAGILPQNPPVVSVMSYGEDDIALRADLSADGWLVLSDAFYPGWEATVDGKPAPILRANIACRAIRMTAGRHQVDFRYRPASLKWGRILTAAGAGLVLAGLVTSCIMRRRNRRGGDGGSGKGSGEQ